MKPKLLLQDLIFSEDEFSDTKSIINKYFDAHEIETNKIFEAKHLGISNFRGSLSLARILGRDYKFANALQWLSHFRSQTVSPAALFTDIKHALTLDFPLFIRPASPFKEFSGDVYTKEKFQQEYDYMVVSKNQNPGLICAFAAPVKIKKEWRLIFIDSRYLSSSQYMSEGDLNIKSSVPQEVIEFGKQIAKDDYFTNVFNFILDIGETDSGLKLIEINGFECSSFYGANLDKIYNAWANSISSFSTR